MSAKILSLAAALALCLLCAGCGGAERGAQEEAEAAFTAQGGRGPAGVRRHGGGKGLCGDLPLLPPDLYPEGL